MFVRYSMTMNPVTLSKDTTVIEARRLLDKQHFRHLPVVDRENHLLGMVTDRDLRSACPSSVLGEEERSRILGQMEKIEVSSIMSINFAVLNPESTLDDALLLFEKRTIGALPVLDAQQRVVGIFSLTDMMLAYRRLFGIGEKGSRLIAIDFSGDSPPLSRLVDLLDEHQVPFTRLVRAGATAREAAMLYLRVSTFNIPAVHRVIEKAGFKIHVPEVPQ